jgi:hypothetical protein
MHIERISEQTKIIYYLGADRPLTLKSLIIVML